MRFSTLSVVSLPIALVLALAAGCQSGDDGASNPPPGVDGVAGAAGVECLEDADCTSGERCLPDNTCGTCWYHTDCQDGLCVAGDCSDRKGCADDSECAEPTPYCAGECVGCLTNENCAADELCIYGACRPRACSDGECAPCTSDSECADDEHCFRGRCAADLCDSGKSRCFSPTAIAYCDLRGAQETLLACPDERGCGGELGAELCAAWTCVPGMTECDETGTSVRTCAPDGQGYEVAQDCGKTDEVCWQGACAPAVCTPNASFCGEGGVRLCNGGGTQSSLQTPCLSGQYCDEETATCKAQVCTPGALGCVGDEKGVCNALGSGYEDLDACELDEVCSQGACLPKICDPNVYSCGADKNPYRCNPLGTALVQMGTCSSSTYCAGDATYTSCQLKACGEGLVSCDGNSLQTCNDVGSGWDPGTDCTLTGQVCYDGACLAQVCTPDTRLCVNGDVHYCVSNGTATSLWADCSNSQYCDAVTATCKTRVCTPGAPGCVGSMATTCKADGSGWEAAGTDCAASGDACEAGVCKDIVCTPNALTCNGEIVEQCNALGTALSTYQNCGTTTAHCYQYDASYAYCRSDICTQGAAACNGTVATTCNADGSGYVAGGTNCADTSQACETGTCKDIICTPSSKFCSGGHVQQCNTLGTSSAQYDFCFSNEFCKTQSATSAVCSPDVCTAGTNGCTLENYGACKADGSAYTSTTDCAASGQICGVLGCASSVDDTIGKDLITQYYSTSFIAGNVLRVDVDRTLTTIKQPLYPQPETVQFVVYKAAALSGPYTPMFDVLGSASSVPGTSGTISVQLKAGSYYFIGVWTLHATNYYVYNYYLENDPPIAQSFGAVLGAYVASAPSGPPASFSNPTLTTSAMIQPQTLTTQPPL